MCKDWAAVEGSRQSTDNKQLIIGKMQQVLCGKALRMCFKGEEGTHQPNIVPPSCSLVERQSSLLTHPLDLDLSCDYFDR